MKIIEFTAYDATEAHRHAAEARYVVSLRTISKKRAYDYLAKVATARNETAAQRLREDAVKLWNEMQDEGEK